MADDTISRQAVDKIIDDLLENDNLQASPSVWHGLHMIKQLPSAQPNLQPTCNQLATDCISRQAAIDFIDAGHLCNPNEPRWSDNEVVNFLKSRPSAQRTGRWKVSDIPKGKMKYCSECGFGQYIADERQYGYCPNCGARMEVEE